MLYEKLFSFIFKLAIIAVVLLFVLNNADTIKDILGDLIGGNLFPKKDDPLVTTGTTPPWESINTKVPDPTVDTITDEEFEIAMSKTNFMMVTDDFYADGSSSSYFGYITDYAKGGRDGDDFDGFQVNYVKVDGVWYYLNYENGSVFGTKLPSEVEVDVTVRSVAYATGVTFSELTYDANKGCYTFLKLFLTDNGEMSVPINLYFNVGKLEFVEVLWDQNTPDECRTVTYFSDYHGEINIPEFTVVK